METLSFCASERILEVFVSFESASTIIAEDDRDIDTDDLFLDMSSITVKDGREETIAYASTIHLWYNPDAATVLLRNSNVTVDSYSVVAFPRYTV